MRRRGQVERTADNRGVYCINLVRDCTGQGCQQDFSKISARFQHCRAALHGTELVGTGTDGRIERRDDLSVVGGRSARAKKGKKQRSEKSESSLQRPGS